MTEFVKKIKLAPEIDKVKAAKFAKNFSDSINEVLPKFKISSDTALPKMFQSFNKGLINTTDRFSNLFEEVKDENGNLLSFSQKFKMDIKNLGMDIIQSFVEKFGKVISDAFDELDVMLQSSGLTSKTTRSNMFAYGFSGAQSYGFEKALDVMGFERDDLMYMNAQQTDLFNKLFKNYTDRYTKLADQGFFEKTLEFQVEEQQFRENVTYRVMEWIVSNKDKLIRFMDFTERVLDALFNVVSGIMDFFGMSVSTPADTVATSDIIEKYAGGNKNYNININDTFNGVDMNNMTNVANTVGLSYEQLVQTLLGG